MFSLYGASRDNDGCCARFGICEISHLVPSKGTSRIDNTDWTVEFQINSAISGTLGYTAGKIPHLDKKNGRLRHTRGDVSLG